MEYLQSRYSQRLPIRIKICSQPLSYSTFAFAFCMWGEEMLSPWTFSSTNKFLVYFYSCPWVFFCVDQTNCPGWLNEVWEMQLPQNVPLQLGRLFSWKLLCAHKRSCLPSSVIQYLSTKQKILMKACKQFMCRWYDMMVYEHMDYTAASWTLAIW